MKYPAILLLLLASAAAQGQNMVHNPGFEQYTACPTTFSQVDAAHLVDWDQPTIGSSDYFNECNSDPQSFDIPLNFFGYQNAYEGVAYTGMYTFANTAALSDEYIRGVLNPLTPGQTYRVSIQVSLADSCSLAADGIGVYFYINGSFPTYTDVLNITPQVDYSSYGPVTNKGSWLTLTGTFYADSAYTHLIIGEFKHFTNVDTILLSGPTHASYYYVDNVEVIPINIVTVASQTNISCNGGSNGSATITPSDGIPPYTYHWLPGNQVTQSITGLAAGTYTCIVTDSVLHTASDTIVITEPVALTANATQVNVNCHGEQNGSATTIVSGGTPPYVYSWTPTGGTMSTANTLSEGTYTCSVTDSNQCTLERIFNIAAPPALSLSTSKTNISCRYKRDGSITVNASGGTPPCTYLWSPVNSSDSTISGLDTGSYSCIVSDAHGCTSIATATITDSTVHPGADFTYEPASPLLDQAVHFYAQTPPGTYNINWNFGDGATSTDTKPLRAYNEVGIYHVCLVAADTGNCMDTICKDVPVNIENSVGLPSAFSPNGDGENDVLYIRGYLLAKVTLYVYDRWGKLVFETGTKEKGWDGTFRGQAQPADAYAYILTATFADGTGKELAGSISLLR